MDAHFNEYLAAVVGMHDLYGHPADDHSSEFHAAGEADAAGRDVAAKPSVLAHVGGVFAAPAR